MASSLDRFLEACAGEIDRRAQLVAQTQPALSDGAQAFHAAIDASAPLEAELTTVALLDVLADVEQTVLAQTAVAVAAQLPWTASSRSNDGGTKIALGAVDRVRHLGEIQCGVVLMGAGCAYPVHDHPPQELYLPLAGRGRWRYGGASDYRELGPDDLVYNHPNDRHAIIAGDGPLLALYVLWT